MRETIVRRFGLEAPDDLSGLTQALAEGLDPASVKAVFAKTEGDGSAADTSRARFMAAFKATLAAARGTTPEEVEETVAILVSGGCEGVLSPHAVVIAAQATSSPTQHDKALAAGVAFTEPLQPHQIGRQAQIDATREAVARALADAGLDDPADVHFVQIKGPALSPDHIAAARVQGTALATEDAKQSIALARSASALGVALALGELDPSRANEAAIATRLDLYSTRASVSSAAEVPRNEVLVLGNAPGWAGDLHIAHGVLADVIDAAGVHGVLAALDISAADHDRLEAIFAKSAPDPRKAIRGHRHVMLDDPAIDGLRHMRAALGGVIAGVVGDTRIFLSGGAEHQGPLGGGLIAAIARRA